MEDIVLGKPGATVVVELQDKAGVRGGRYGGEADRRPGGISHCGAGSWLHPLGFRQLAVTSAQGQARFTGIPPGRIIVRVKTADGASEQQGVAVSGKELQLTLSMP